MPCRVATPLTHCATSASRVMSAGRTSTPAAASARARSPHRRRLVEVAERDRRSLRREPLDYRAADPARPAGHDGGPALQRPISVSCRSGSRAISRAVPRTPGPASPPAPPRLAGGDRFENRAMLGQRSPGAARQAARGLEAHDERRIHHASHLFQQIVRRRANDGRWKRMSASLNARVIAATRTIMAATSISSNDPCSVAIALRSARMAASAAACGSMMPRPRSASEERGAGRLVVLPGHDVGIEQIPGVPRRHPRADLRLGLDQPLGGEHLDRLAQRRPAGRSAPESRVSPGRRTRRAEYAGRACARSGRAGCDEGSAGRRQPGHRLRPNMIILYPPCAPCYPSALIASLAYDHRTDQPGAGATRRNDRSSRRQDDRELFTLRNKSGVEVEAISLRRDHHLVDGRRTARASSADIVLGFDDRAVSQG